jgi:hypothetical protein
MHPTDPYFARPAYEEILSNLKALRLHQALCFIISPDRIDDACALLRAADRFDLVWINGFVRMDNARRDYQTMLMVRGGRVQIDQILPTLPIAGHVLAFGNGSFKVFKAGIANPIDIGNPLTRDDLELAYTKVTGAKRRFALADAYRDYGSGYGGMVVRQAMRALGYL